MSQPASLPKLTPIDRILPNFSARAEDPPQGPAEQSKVRHALNLIFGQSASFLEPLLFRSGRLLIYVTAPVWTTHIRHRQPSIISTLQELALEITEIKVHVLPADAIIQPAPTPPERPTATSKTLDTLKAASQTVQNNNLRMAIERLQKRLKHT